MPLTRSFSLRKLISRVKKCASSRTVSRKLLTFLKSGYVPLKEEECDHGEVPKGYMAVYIGREEGELSRVMVPVVYFNHPLFGELLREAEEEFGFCRKGGITIPCGVTEFERVKKRVDAVGRGGSDPRRRRRRKALFCGCSWIGLFL